MENAPSDNNNINQNQNTGTNIKVDLGGRQKGGFLNEASVSPTGFQQYGSWITNLDYHHHAIWIVMIVLILFTSTFDYLGIAYDEQLNRYGPLTKDISSLEIFLYNRRPNCCTSDFCWASTFFSMSANTLSSSTECRCEVTVIS